MLPKYRVVVLVHGCFWHQHSGCKKATLPKANREQWAGKLARNVERDVENVVALEAAGWRTAIVWECESRDVRDIVEALAPVLSDITERAHRAGIVVERGRQEPPSD